MDTCVPPTGPVALCNHTDFLESVEKTLKKKMNLSVLVVLTLMKVNIN